jgi:aerobic carbon-monoxide dehydrogenase medium subunit
MATGGQLVKAAPFEYHAPGTLEEALALLAEFGDEAKVLAGGQSLVPVLALRLARFGHLIDLNRITALRYVAVADGVTRIGAMTTQAAIGGSPDVLSAVPLLARATAHIGHFQIRNRGTIGGSLAHADAAAEYPAVAIALGAVLETLSPRGQRTIPATEFFTGIWSTALAADELLTAITFPVWRGPRGFAIEEFARRPGDFAVAGAAVAVELSDDGSRIRRCGIGLFGLGPTPLRATAAEAALAGAPLAGASTSGGLAAQIGQTAVADLESVPSDVHGSASYRKRVGAAMVAAAVERAIGEARNA